MIDATHPAERSATEGAYRKLRLMILRGDLVPGGKLKIEHLRQILGTGSSPVREALSLLTSDRLVERIEQRGFRTTPISREDFEEILRLRVTLELTALGQSLAAGDEAWEETLVLAHHKMTRAPRDDLERFETHHKAFHMTLLAAAPAPLTLRLCSQLYDLNIRYRFLAARSETYQMRDVSGEHAAILEAAIDRDVETCSERLRRHYDNTGRFLNGLFPEA